MNYCVSVNGKIIEASIPHAELERRSHTTWLKAQAQGLRVEVAEAGTQNFRPLDQFLSSATQPSGSGHSTSPSTPQPAISGNNSQNPISSSTTQRLNPSSFNNPQQPTTPIPQRPDSTIPAAFPPPANTPANYPNFPQPNVPVAQPTPPPPTFGAQWVVVAETNRLDPALHGCIRPEHYGHNGPWLVRGQDLAPIAGFWICNAARTIDGALVIVTLGVYLIFLCMAIAQGRQTPGQKLAGVRMIKQSDLTPASIGQFLGSVVCYAILSLIPVVSLLVFVQGFTEKKQGLNHMLCGVMHVEERHYDVGRGAWMTILGMIGVGVFYVILIILLSILMGGSPQ